MQTPNRRTPEAVVFDMGGVLVDLAPLSFLLGAHDGDLWARWIRSPAVREFEAGSTDPDSFAQRIVEEFSIPGGPEEFLVRFRAMPRGLLPGAAELLNALSHVEIGLLSNTNAVHWETQPDADEINRLIDRPYLSYKLAMVKPDAEIFSYVASDLDLDPTKILFLDDNQINVDGALRCGFQAHRVSGVQGCVRPLRQVGVLADDFVL